ncbi:MAG: hypothetical protein R3302_05280 [Sulfurimonadaceae bacterium]|nr:hypothetical protein [Sulfurimonadaceae bacterium]
MSDNKSIELAKKAVKEGFDKYNKEATFHSPVILKAMVKAYAFDMLHNVCDKECEMNNEIDFPLFASTVNEEVEAKLSIHFENPIG